MKIARKTNRGHGYGVGIFEVLAIMSFIEFIIYGVILFSANHFFTELKLKKTIILYTFELFAIFFAALKNIVIFCQLIYLYFMY